MSIGLIEPPQPLHLRAQCAAQHLTSRGASVQEANDKEAEKQTNSRKAQSRQTKCGGLTARPPVLISSLACDLLTVVAVSSPPPLYPTSLRLHSLFPLLSFHVFEHED